MSELIHVSIDKILSGWKSSFGYEEEGDYINECSVGRIAPWGGHYICIIHDDVPEDEREEIAEFIATAPKKITDLEQQLATSKAECDRLNGIINKSLEQLKANRYSAENVSIFIENSIK